jgi:uncharacterized protein YdhG (YjbR/CyaY superfamily)
MRKTSSVSRRRKTAVSKRRATMTVDDYFACVPEPARSTLTKLRVAIRSIVPRKATETINYQMPTFKGDRGIIVWFAAFADHVSLFPRASVLAEFKDELTGFKVSKGTVQDSAAAIDSDADGGVTCGRQKQLGNFRIARCRSIECRRCFCVPGRPCVHTDSGQLTATRSPSETFAHNLGIRHPHASVASAIA